MKVLRYRWPTVARSRTLCWSVGHLHSGSYRSQLFDSSIFLVDLYDTSHKWSSFWMFLKSCELWTVATHEHSVSSVTVTSLNPNLGHAPKKTTHTAGTNAPDHTKVCSRIISSVAFILETRLQFGQPINIFQFLVVLSRHPFGTKGGLNWTGHWKLKNL